MKLLAGSFCVSLIKFNFVINWFVLLWNLFLKLKIQAKTQRIYRLGDYTWIILILNTNIYKVTFFCDNNLSYEWIRSYILKVVNVDWHFQLQRNK